MGHLARGDSVNLRRLGLRNKRDRGVTLMGLHMGSWSSKLSLDLRLLKAWWSWLSYLGYVLWELRLSVLWRLRHSQRSWNLLLSWYR